MGDSDNKKSEVDRKIVTIAALRRIEAGNSDIELTNHAVKMMARREINSNMLADAIYSDKDPEVEDTGEIVYKSVSSGNCIEAICVPVPNDSYFCKIRVITVHKL